LADFKNSGSNSRPIPAPVGTGITPLRISKFGVYQDSFFAGPRETYSIHGPMLGVVAANCRILTDAAPAWVLCGQIHILALRAMRATRAARMKIFNQFTSDLDSSGEKISQELSEVDLSNPEDVKALIPDHSMDILVHFGDTDFLDRYRKFQQHLPEWRTVYPKLSSVDMRYERQVVLEMQPGSTVPVTDSGAPAPTGEAPTTTSATTTPPHSAKKSVANAAPKPHGAAVKHPAAAKGKAAAKAAGHGRAQAPVRAKSGTAKAAHSTTAKHPPVVVRPAAGAPPYHPPQVVHP